MSKYRQCPNCYGQSKGNKVVQCTKCNKVYCSGCKGWTFLGGYVCPNCKSSGYRGIGTIDPKA